MFKFILLCIITLNGIGQCYTDTENLTFIPTNEMKEIKDGQTVPSGLHYRINLTTGKKEAKLLDEDDSKETKDYDSKNKYEKKLAIKKQIIKSSGLTEKSIKELKEQFKKSQDGKKKQEKLIKSITVKTDSELIKTFIKTAMEFKRGEDHRMEYINIIENCNILVHQIDNALTFIEHGGIEHIILPTITNQTNIQVRIKSMRLIGALAQNNPVAQKKVFEKNIAVHLCHILLTSKHSIELSTALYALGSILRKFPEAQKGIMSTLGIEAIVKLIVYIDVPLKIQIKSLILLSDLIAEKRLETQHKPDSDLNTFYKEIHFDDWLNNYQFCTKMEVLVLLNKNELSKNGDLMEYLIEAMTNMYFICYESWSKNSDFRTHLNTIAMALVDKNDDYLKEIAESTVIFVEKIELKNERDEL